MVNPADVDGQGRAVGIAQEVAGFGKRNTVDSPCRKSRYDRKNKVEQENENQDKHQAPVVVKTGLAAFVRFGQVFAHLLTANLRFFMHGKFNRITA